jgi:putative membrane protein
VENPGALPSPLAHGKLPALGATTVFSLMSSFDLWIKVLHIVAVISWMAGMLYLPRLFVYHADAERKSAVSEQFKIMERRLLKGIVTPAMIVVWASGLTLAWRMGFFMSGWLHVKLALVFALTGLHGYFAGRVRAFAEDRETHKAIFFRVLNEIPTVIMILIVCLVVLQPF